MPPLPSLPAYYRIISRVQAWYLSAQMHAEPEGKESLAFWPVYSPTTLQPGDQIHETEEAVYVVRKGPGRVVPSVIVGERSALRIPVGHKGPFRVPINPAFAMRIDASEAVKIPVNTVTNATANRIAHVPDSALFPRAVSDPGFVGRVDLHAVQNHEALL
jgi:hypothetical protein